MAHAQPAVRYRRHRRVRWMRNDRRSRPPTARGLLEAIPSLPRPVLARLTEAMINRLDDIDGDPDLEPDHEDEAHDGREEEIAL